MSKDVLKPVIIGKASFIDFEKFADWCLSDEANTFFSTENLWTGNLYNLQGKVQGVNFGKLHDAVKPTKTYDGEIICSGRKRYYIEPLKDIIQYISTFSSPNVSLSFALLYEHPQFDIIAFSDSQFLIPAGNLNKTLYNDYSNISIGALHTSLNSFDKSFESGLVPVGSSLSSISLNSQKSCIEGKKAELESLEKDLDDVKNARVGELAELQAEIDRRMAILQAKKEKMLAVLNAKKAEMELQKKKLEQELFMLESEIYSIRCFLGEVIDFIQLRSGMPAATDQPITLFQKIRFLDEEMGKAVSVYDFDFKDAKLFEKLLKARDDAFELFCPNNKCVSLVRVSKTNIAYALRDTEYGEMLQKYEVYHGKKIGILVRNGENLYLGWTDDEKINIPEDLFFTPSTKVVDEDNKEKVDSTPVEEVVSRYFVFSILQGILENSNLLALPKDTKVSFFAPSQYIIFSVADAWLSDNRFGSLRDIVEKANSRISVGDSIISIDHITDGYTQRGWGGSYYREFDRDHNYSRRTHDVKFCDGVIYPIRLIEDDKYDKKAYYVSLVKDGWDHVYRNGEYMPRQRDAHALFRVYTDEFVNLTYMNSVWLRYVITTRNLGGYGRMGQYAEVIRYLNKALDFVKEREIEEKGLIEQYYPALSSDPDWPVKLSEWKLEHNVRNITDYQAKRFAKTL